MIEQQLLVAKARGVGDSAFLGEVPVSELITGDALASAIGLTAGTAQHSNEPWLHFVDPVDGLTKYVAKKPYRSHISWDHLNAVNVVYGSRTLEINGETYRIRLLKGVNSDPYEGENGSDPVGAYGSEWNRLLYPLIPDPRYKPATGISGEGLVYGAWANYTEADLVMVDVGGNGRSSWCQETQSTNAAIRILRGSDGVSPLSRTVAYVVSAVYGWRPVLELVEKTGF